jgi:hypothetical protein
MSHSQSSDVSTQLSVNFDQGELSRSLLPKPARPEGVERPVRVSKPIRMAGSARKPLPPVNAPKRIRSCVREIHAAIDTAWLVNLRAPVDAGKSSELPLVALKHPKVKRVIHVVPSGIFENQLGRYMNGRLNRNYTIISAKKALRRNLVESLRPGDLVVLDEIHLWTLEQEGLVGLLLQRLCKAAQELDPPFQVIFASATFDVYGRRSKALKALGDERIKELVLCESHTGAPVIDLPAPEEPGSIPLSAWDADWSITDPLLLRFFRTCLDSVLRGYPVVVGLLPGAAKIKQVAAALEEAKRCVPELRPYRVFGRHRDIDGGNADEAFAHVSTPKIVLGTESLGVGHTFALPNGASQSLGIALVDGQTKYEVRKEQGMVCIEEVGVSLSEIKQRRGRATKSPYPGAYRSVPLSECRKRLEEPKPPIQLLGIEQLLLTLRVAGHRIEDLPLVNAPDDFERQCHTALRSLEVLGCSRRDGSLTAKGVAVEALGVGIAGGLAVLEMLARAPYSRDEAFLIGALLRSGCIADRHSHDQVPYPLHARSDVLSQFRVLQRIDIHLQLHPEEDFSTQCELHGLNERAAIEVLSTAKHLARAAEHLSEIITPALSEVLSTPCPVSPYEREKLGRWIIYSAMRDQVFVKPLWKENRRSKTWVDADPVTEDQMIVPDERVSSAALMHEAACVASVVDHLGVRHMSQVTIIDLSWLSLEQGGEVSHRTFVQGIGMVMTKRRELRYRSHLLALTEPDQSISDAHELTSWHERKTRGKCKDRQKQRLRKGRLVLP